MLKKRQEIAKRFYRGLPVACELAKIIITNSTSPESIKNGQYPEKYLHLLPKFKIISRMIQNLGDNVSLVSERSQEQYIETYIGSVAYRNLYETFVEINSEAIKDTDIYKLSAYENTHKALLELNIIVEF